MSTVLAIRVSSYFKGLGIRAKGKVLAAEVIFRVLGAVVIKSPLQVASNYNRAFSRRNIPPTLGGPIFITFEAQSQALGDAGFIANR